MENRSRKIVVTILATILLAFLAFYFSDDFTEFVLHQFKELNVKFAARGLSEQSYSTFTFVFVIAMLPSLFLFSSFVLKGQKSWIFWVIIPVTIICGIALMSFHIYSLGAESEFSELVHMVQNTMSVSQIHGARYLGIGFLMGAILSTAILSFLTRDRKS